MFNLRGQVRGVSASIFEDIRGQSSVGNVLIGDSEEVESVMSAC